MAQQPAAFGVDRLLGPYHLLQAVLPVEHVQRHTVGHAVRQQTLDIDEGVAVTRPQPLLHVKTHILGQRARPNQTRLLLQRRRHQLADDRDQQHQHQRRLHHRQQYPPHRHAGRPNHRQLVTAGQRAQSEHAAEQRHHRKQLVGLTRHQHQAVLQRDRRVVVAVTDIIELVDQGAEEVHGEQHQHHHHGVAEHRLADIAVEDPHARTRRGPRSFC